MYSTVQYLGVLAELRNSVLNQLLLERHAKLGFSGCEIFYYSLHPKPMSNRVELKPRLRTYEYIPPLPTPLPLLSFPLFSF